MNNDFLKKFLAQAKEIMAQKREYLIDLDSVVGDGDLGLTMSDGFAAAYDIISDSSESDAGKLLYSAGKAMSTAVPSTMGTLMASGLMEAGKALKGKDSLENADIVALFEAYQAGVAKRGKAEVGEKTFLDGIDPAVSAMKSQLNAGADLGQIATAGLKAAEEGYKNTATMLAKHGRAATRGEASIILEDPGAAVAVLLMQALCNATA